MPDAIAQFVLRVGDRKIGRRIAPRTALDRDDVEACIGQLVGQNRAGPAQADDDDVFAGKFARHLRARYRSNKAIGGHERSSRLSVRPVRMIGDADRRQRHALVMRVDPIAIIVMRAGKPIIFHDAMSLLPP